MSDMALLPISMGGGNDAGAAGHSESEIIQSAMADFKGQNTIGGALLLIANGKPSAK